MKIILISPLCNCSNLNRKVSIFESYIAVLGNIIYSIPTKIFTIFHQININMNNIFQAWIISLYNKINVPAVLISEHIKIYNSTFKKKNLKVCNNFLPKRLYMR